MEKLFEAFIYIWTDRLKDMMYIGSHKGTPDDGYITSSKLLKEEYSKRPQDFSRVVVAYGTNENIKHIESAMLQKVGAAKNPQFYNMNNSDGKFYVSKHTEITKQKMSIAAKGKKKSPEQIAKMLETRKQRPENFKWSEDRKARFIKATTGQKRSSEQRARISASLKGKTLGQKKALRTQEHQRKLWESRKNNNLLRLG